MDHVKGYIFRCSNSTEDECFERMLFGGASSYQKVIEQIKVGDILFLYNLASERLHGEFETTSEGQKKHRSLCLGSKVSLASKS